MIENKNNEARLTRFKDASWLGNKEYCIIGGAGGISSWLALMLTRANFMPVVYDFDNLEEHNLGGQLFPFSGVGQPKVDVLAKVVKDFTGMDISILNEKYDRNSMTGMFVFSGFDNMKAREDMFTVWLNNVLIQHFNERRNFIFIDGRLTAPDSSNIISGGDELLES